MSFVFEFDNRESFRTKEASEFATLLLKSPPSVRERLRKNFGLSIDVSFDPIRLMHDGQRVGIGGFQSTYGPVNFTIGPKVAFRVEELVDAMQASKSWSHLVRISRESLTSPVASGTSDFNPAFLLCLLQDIADYAARHVDITHRRRKEFVGWAPRGRPLIADTIRRTASGRCDGLVCEVYDDRAFQPYADVLVGTAESVFQVLNRWGQLVRPVQAEVENARRRIKSVLAPAGSGQFSMGLLLKTCRPPFPFGLRQLLYNCMRYWQWRGTIRVADQSMTNLGYWELILRLDDLFESYVGEIWGTALSEAFEKSSLVPYAFRIGDFHSSNELKPDHLFRDRHQGRLIVVDAKYRVDIGSSEQLYQILAYLDYKYPDENDFPHRIGVLVYPSLSWKCSEVKGFRHQIYCVQLPVTASFNYETISEMVEHAFTQQECEATYQSRQN